MLEFYLEFSIVFISFFFFSPGDFLSLFDRVVCRLSPNFLYHIFSELPLFLF